MQVLRTTRVEGALQPEAFGGVYARQTAQRAAAQRRLERRQHEQSQAAVAECTFRPALVVRSCHKFCAF